MQALHDRHTLQMRMAPVVSVPPIDNRLLCLSVLVVVVMLQAAGRPVHRTAFTRGAADGSLLFNPFDMQLKNVANTGVLHWGNKLLTLYEVRRVHSHTVIYAAVSRGLQPHWNERGSE